MVDQSVRWRRSSRSSSSNCVEVSSAGEIRDSKDRSRRSLRVDVAALLASVRAGRFDV